MNFVWAFDSLRLERAALTSLALKPGEMQLNTSWVQCIQLRIRFTPRSSLTSLNEAHSFMHAYECIDLLCWLTHALLLSMTMQMLLLGLLSVRIFSIHHISLVPFANSNLCCQIRRFTSVVSRDTS